MRKGTDVIGLPVYTRSQGEEKESVKDIIFDHKSNQILALVLDDGGWFSDARVVRWADIQSIGPDAVIIPSDDVIVRADSTSEVKAVLEEGNVLKDTQILTTEGRDLGSMTDVYFHEDTGALTGYEVSGGLFSDAASGRSYVPALHALTVGQDAAFVPPATAELMEEQVGGIKGAVESVGQKVQETVQDATSNAQASAQAVGQQVQEPASDAAAAIQEKAADAQDVVREKAQELADRSSEAMEEVREKAGHAAEVAGERWQSTKEAAQEKASELTERAKSTLQDAQASASEQLEQADIAVRDHAEQISSQVSETVESNVAQASVDMAKGRRARMSVRLESGAYLVVVGQIVTDSIVKLARMFDRESDLLAAVGLETHEAAKMKTSEVASEVQERVKEGAEVAVDKTKVTVGMAKEKLEAMREGSRDPEIHRN